MAVAPVPNSGLSERRRNSCEAALRVEWFFLLQNVEACPRQFVRQRFDRLGGFDELVRYEDLDFSLRLRKAGRTALLVPPVLSSARRFAAKGVVRQTLVDFFAALSFVMGHR